MKTLIICLLLCVALIKCDEGDELSVTIKNGAIKGSYMKTKSGREFRAFRKIPYAKAPIGNLRFEPPEPAENWSDIKDATEDMPQCVSNDILIGITDVTGEEDCLFLNVYTLKKSENEEKLPVMVYIHGGGFHSGSGNSLSFPPGYLMDKDIVLVSINYRLGPLGFLTTGDDVVPGNNALKDQVMALKWVQENIDKFGGNPESVVIFGESAGGGSTHFHLLSPLSKGLIHGAISQSGAATTAWGTISKENGLEYTHKLAKLHDCPTSPSKEMVDCLRKVDAKELMAYIQKFLIWDVEPPIFFRPVIEEEHEGAFLSESVDSAIKSAKGPDVPWMLGLNSQDGALRSSSVVGKHLTKEFDEKFNETVSGYLFDNGKNYPEGTVERLRQFYFGDTPITEKSKDNITDLYTDLLFAPYVMNAVDLHKKFRKSPIYFYELGYRGALSFSIVFGQSDIDFGVSHGDDLLYLFPIRDRLTTDQISENDQKMVNIMTTLWVNFAIYKNPTPNNDLNVIWQPVKTENKEFLKINLGKMKMEENMFGDRMAFWKSIKQNVE